MKEFSLEEYLAHPERKVVTREGKKVRIICTDAKSIYPVMGLVDEGIFGERFVSCQKNGRGSNDIFESKDDLFFVEKNERNHEGWMNLYKKGFGLVKGGDVYNSEEEAKKIAAGDEDYITTIKIEWEE